MATALACDGENVLFSGGEVVESVFFLRVGKDHFVGCTPANWAARNFPVLHFFQSTFPRNSKKRKDKKILLTTQVPLCKIGAFGL